MRTCSAAVLLLVVGCVGTGSSLPNRLDAGAGDAAVDVAIDAGVDAGQRDAGPIDPGSDGGKNPTLTALADNTVLDLGEFACTEVSGNNDCWGVIAYGGFTYDSNHHQFLMFGGGHATTMTDTVFAFDLDKTLSWRELYQPTPCEAMTPGNLDAALGAWKSGASGPYPRPLSAHIYDQIDFSPATNDFVVVGRHFTGGYCSQVGNDVNGPVAHLNFTTQQWSFAANTPLDSLDGTELDPVSGNLIIFGGTGLRIYNPVTKTLTVGLDTYNGDTLKDGKGNPVDMSNFGYANHLVYFQPTDTFYYFLRGAPVETYSLKLNRATPAASILEHVATTGPTSPHGEPGYASDSHNQIIGGGVFDNTFYAFDPATSKWTSSKVQGGTPGDQSFHAINFDPVNNVFVFIDSNRPIRTWAYRFKK